MNLISVLHVMIATKKIDQKKIVIIAISKRKRNIKKKKQKNKKQLQLRKIQRKKNTDSNASNQYVIVFDNMTSVNIMNFNVMSFYTSVIENVITMTITPFIKELSNASSISSFKQN